MKKSTAINFINKIELKQVLSNKNTNFATINSRRPVWWMNIKLERLKEDFNILLVGENDLFWLKIPANSFEPYRDFRIWKEKNAIDLYISSDKNDRYFKDISSGARGVDFKPFIFKTLPIPETLKKELKEEGKISKKSRKRLPTSRQFEIQQNQKDISYDQLFGDYLKGSGKVILQDPYIRFHHQFENLVEFCQMLEAIKENGQNLDFELITWNSDDFKNNSLDYLQSLKDSLEESGINFSYKFEDNHDRYIQTDTGWKILLGRGLDIFHKVNSKISLAHRDQTKRRCKACEITYLHIPESNKKSI
ncbi:MIT C-terminal domain-containing protein [Salegentibacter mishustinae]|uniref:MIT C-terminal domain-containing protein n=1 Tax=Salegentibacter mishustinae TaxID=270918 RepID=UPI00249383B6|nr:MIT C-terminal domain-containing protein [Salegentibacter mishustinae]